MNYPNHRKNYKSNQKGNYRQKHTENRISIKLEPDKIKKDEMFIEHAKDIADKFKRGGKNQIRKFYDEFNVAIESPNTFKLRMLLPKIHYQKSRKVLADEMAQFLEQLIQLVVGNEQLDRDRAKSFFTAVYGFYGEGK